MAHQKIKLTGKDGFETYYAALFGERWAQLSAALLGEPVYAEWNAGGKKTYFLDTGSVLAALCLPLEGAHTVLDLCAAPGGKTLVLASRMDSDAELISNDRSPARRLRLANVLDDCLPDSIRQRVTVSCSDGAKWCTRQTDCFDRILLDAPCSSERHVLTDPKYLAEWTPSRIKTLAVEQWALLSSAYRMLVPGGYMIYSTCALCPDENDRVVEKLFKKFAAAYTPDTDFSQLDCSKFSSVPAEKLPGTEKTEYGFHVLPDRQHGAGPLYFSVIGKRCLADN